MTRKQKRGYILIAIAALVVVLLIALWAQGLNYSKRHEFPETPQPPAQVEPL